MDSCLFFYLETCRWIIQLLVPNLGRYSRVLYEHIKETTELAWDTYIHGCWKPLFSFSSRFRCIRSDLPHHENRIATSSNMGQKTSIKFCNRKIERDTWTCRKKEKRPAEYFDGVSTMIHLTNALLHNSSQIKSAWKCQKYRRTVKVYEMKSHRVTGFFGRLYWRIMTPDFRVR